MCVTDGGCVLLREECVVVRDEWVVLREDVC